MFTHKRLTEVFRSAKEVPFDDQSKFIFFSDCHRGDSGWADDFARNQNLFFYALKHYYKNGFTYIELGDGDELWENKNFEDIVSAHNHIFSLMRKFYDDRRFYLLIGNHDDVRKNPKYVRRRFCIFQNERTRKIFALFQEIEVHEGLILKHTTSGKKIFLVHGHQGDLWNTYLAGVSRFMVRYFWRRFQVLGINDPTSPAQNYIKREKIQKKLIEWVRKNNQTVIAGHTHFPIFPEQDDDPPYYNDGSCIHPRSITGIEIENGEIALIKWWLEPNEKGALYVTKELLAGPRKL